MRFPWIALRIALILQICVFGFFSEVAAAEDANNASQVFTIHTGETANLFWPRSDREGLNEFRKYRAWKDNVFFAIITKGNLTAICPQTHGDLQKFCLTQVEFKIWNKTHLILKVKNTTFNNSGNYSIEHVFGSVKEGNYMDKIIQLNIEAEPTVATPAGQDSTTKDKNLSTSAEPSPTTFKSSTVSSVGISFSTEVGPLLILLLCVLLISTDFL